MIFAHWYEILIYRKEQHIITELGILDAEPMNK